MSNIPTVELIALLQQDEAKGLSQLVKQYSADFAAFLHKKVGREKEDAQAIFVETLLAIRENAITGKLGHVNDLKGYVFSSGYHLWQRMYERKKKESQAMASVKLDFYNYLEEDEVEVKMAKTRQEALLDMTLQAMQTLSEKCRRLIRYVYFDKKRMNEIAQLMGFNGPEVASASKYRCIQELKGKVLKMESEWDTISKQN